MEFICLMLAIISLLLLKKASIIAIIIASINIIMSICIIKIKEELGNKILIIISIILSLISVIIGILLR